MALYPVLCITGSRERIWEKGQHSSYFQVACAEEVFPDYIIWMVRYILLFRQKRKLIKNLTISFQKYVFMSSNTCFHWKSQGFLWYLPTPASQWTLAILAWTSSWRSFYLVRLKCQHTYFASGFWRRWEGRFHWCQRFWLVDSRA